MARKLDKKILELEHQQRALRASEQRFRDFAEIAADWFWETDADLNLIFLSEGFNEATGLQHEQVLGRCWHRLYAESGGDPQQWRGYIELLRSRQAFGECQFHWRHPDGSTRVLLLGGRPVYGDDGATFLGYRGVGRDITEAHTLSQQLSYQASHDELTGLVNRREFEQRLQRLLDGVGQPGPAARHALCYLDLDQFKVINDTCGHTAGDALLRQLAGLLREQVRKGDTLARLGGDEFGILLEDCSLDQAQRVANAVRQTIEQFQFSWDRQTFRVGVSLGLVPINAEGDIATVLSLADSACYAAKDKGGNQVYLVREDDTAVAERRGEMRWVSRLGQAFDDNRFELYFQPIAAAADFFPNADVGLHYELLLRMRDEAGTVVLPAQFLPAAERYNLARQIDRWVVRRALEWLSEQRHHLDRLSLCFINLSGQSLTDPRFRQFVDEQFREWGVPADKIAFEITETNAIANLTEARRLITALHDLGCRFALDDFGSGFCSFAYLKQLPVDFLKIDGLFVQDIDVNPVGEAVVKSINDIGHVMGKQTIAEFVESEQVLARLRALGVDFAQGYGIGAPQPVSEMVFI